MKIQFNISQKLGINNISIVICVLATALYSINQLNQSSQKNDLIYKTYEPSIEVIEKCFELLDVSNRLTGDYCTMASEGPDVLAELGEFRSEITTVQTNFLQQRNHLIETCSVEDTSVLTRINEILLISDSLISQQNNIFQQDLSNPEKNMMILSKFIQKSNLLKESLSSLENILESEAEIFKEEINDSNEIMSFLLYMLMLLTVIAGTSSYFVTYNNIVKPINLLRDTIYKLSKGKLPEVDLKGRKDEVGEMVNSIKQLTENLTKTAEFSKSIGEGNLNSQFSALSDDDILGNSLITMRENLKRVATEELQRTWSIQGNAKFGDLLRENNHDLKLLCEQVVVELVKYLDCLQGGFFVLQDGKDEQVMSLTAFYAFDRLKFAEDDVFMGEGLVGQCWQEGESIFLTEIPDDFMEIKSGLGGAQPTSILLTPLISNEIIYGVLELASFQELEEYKVKFVEHIGESIATTLSTVQTNIKTSELLTESKSMAEQMQAQEEELRQNTEEMLATQEELQKRIEYLERKLDSYEN